MKRYRLIYDAATRGLPRCPRCNAPQSEPCRAPNGRTIPPHKEREVLALGRLVEHGFQVAFRATKATSDPEGT